MLPSSVDKTFHVPAAVVCCGLSTAGEPMPSSNRVLREQAPLPGRAGRLPPLSGASPSRGATRGGNSSIWVTPNLLKGTISTRHTSIYRHWISHDLRFSPLRISIFSIRDEYNTKTSHPYRRMHSVGTFIVQIIYTEGVPTSKLNTNNMNRIHQQNCFPSHHVFLHTKWRHLTNRWLSRSSDSGIPQLFSVVQDSRCYSFHNVMTLDEEKRFVAFEILVMMFWRRWLINDERIKYNFARSNPSQVPPLLMHVGKWCWLSRGWHM